MGRGQGLEARAYFQGCSPMCKGQALEARLYFQGRTSQESEIRVGASV